MDKGPLFITYLFTSSAPIMYEKLKDRNERLYYYVIDYFSSSEELTHEVLKVRFEKELKRPNESNEKIGPFFDVDEVKLFSINFMQDFKFQGLHLLSVDDYNKAIFESENSKDVMENLRQYSQFIENTAFSNSQNGLFRRFFKDHQNS